MRFRWETFGFNERAPSADGAKCVLYRVAGGVSLELCYSGDSLIASVGSEHHMVSEDEALAWFSILLPELAAYASKEMQQRFSRWTPQRWAEG